MNKNEKKLTDGRPRCQKTVRTPGLGFGHFHQCERAGTFKREGATWCKTHDPKSVAERAATRQAKFDLQIKQRFDSMERAAICRKVVDSLAEALDDGQEIKMFKLEGAGRGYCVTIFGDCHCDARSEASFEAAVEKAAAKFRKWKAK